MFRFRLFLLALQATATLCLFSIAPCAQATSAGFHSDGGFAFSRHGDDDLWEAVRSQFQLNHFADNPDVEDQIAWYSHHPTYLKRILRRAKPYLYYIFTETQKRKMPGELALIPIVESAYNPFVYSHVGAAGLWQLMPHTATRYGVRLNWWYDGRRDVFASTKAALDYLAYLNEFFDNNWYLSMAAYDSGEGTVLEAMKRNERDGFSRRFWSLRLPQETRAYVPKILAVATIIANPERYNITLPKVENEPYLTEVRVGTQIDLAQAAKLAEVKINLIYALNPGYNRWATDPNGPHRLILPIEQADTFKKNLAALPKDQRVTWQRHITVPGDNLITLARHYKTTAHLIREVNHLKSSRLKIGQTLFIPKSRRVSAGKIASLYKIPHALTRRHLKPERVNLTHKVQPGESFWSIAHKYQVTIRDLLKWNHLTEKAKLRQGNTLTLWKLQPKKNVTQYDFNSPQHKIVTQYFVKSGDSLGKIAQRHHLTTAHLKAANNLKSNRLQPGQRLVIPKRKKHS